MIEERNKKLNKWLWIVIGIIGVLLIIGVGMTFSLNKEVKLLKESEQFKASVVPEEITPQEEIPSIETQKEAPSIEYKTPPVKTPQEILKIEGTSNKKTDIFLADKREWTITFLIGLDEFPSPDKIPSYRVSLYQVGKENPVWTYQDEISIDVLKKVGWSPTFTTPGALEPPGTVGGIVGPTFKGPGEFYFKIEVKNVDRWILKVTESLG